MRLISGRINGGNGMLQAMSSSCVMQTTVYWDFNMKVTQDDFWQHCETVLPNSSWNSMLTKRD